MGKGRKGNMQKPKRKEKTHKQRENLYRSVGSVVSHRGKSRTFQKILERLSRNKGGYYNEQKKHGMTDKGERKKPRKGSDGRKSRE